MQLSVVVPGLASLGLDSMDLCFTGSDFTGRSSFTSRTRPVHLLLPGNGLVTDQKQANSQEKP